MSQYQFPVLEVFYPETTGSQYIYIEAIRDDLEALIAFLHMLQPHV